MNFTEYLIDEELTEVVDATKKLFGRFSRRQPTPEPEVPSKPTVERDPDETPRRRFLRRLDELYRYIARVASHAYDAGIDEETLIEELAETVRNMYHKKEVRKERKQRGRFRGEEDTH
jgi:hypothetical protein